MSTWNMPPGVSTRDIPGNEPECEGETLATVAQTSDILDAAKKRMRYLAWLARSLQNAAAHDESGQTLRILAEIAAQELTQICEA